MHQSRSLSNVPLTSNINSGEQLCTEIENECLHLPHTQSLSMAVESAYFRVSSIHHHYNNFQYQFMFQYLFFQEILESFGSMIFYFFHILFLFKIFQFPISAGSSKMFTSHLNFLISGTVKFPQNIFFKSAFPCSYCLDFFYIFSSVFQL